MDEIDRAQLIAYGMRPIRPDLGANAYQALAMRTSTAHDTPDHRLINAALGLVGEAGEIANPVGIYLNGDLLVERLLTLAGLIGQAADHVKKGRYHGKSLNYPLLYVLLAGMHQGVEDVRSAILQETADGRPDPASVSLHQVDGELRAELGDLAWYITQAADSRGWRLADVLQGNIDKLKARWPQGFQQADAPKEG